ncbi:MAG: hypothetical protein LW807_05545 [Proteobacteria bacterium]|jgi:hypothetical protein|nr:hypothetical protein [Pseudomonadota bacterium]
MIYTTVLSPNKNIICNNGKCDTNYFYYLDSSLKIADKYDEFNLYWLAIADKLSAGEYMLLTPVESLGKTVSALFVSNMNINLSAKVFYLECYGDKCANASLDLTSNVINNQKYLVLSMSAPKEDYSALAPEYYFNNQYIIAKVAIM